MKRTPYGRPTTPELDAMQEAIRLRYPWFYMLFPECKRGHWMGQLGTNPEFFITIKDRSNNRGQSVLCVRCVRGHQQRWRKKQKDDT